MTALLLALALMAGPPGAPPRPALTQSPTALHCRIEIAAGAKGKRCKVTVPERRQVRRCTEDDRRAGHCDARVGGDRYVAWVVGTGPGRCRITKKNTKWSRQVSARLSKSEGAASTCDLYVELQ